jgi:hypothetical protein
MELSMIYIGKYLSFNFRGIQEDRQKKKQTWYQCFLK